MTPALLIPTSAPHTPHDPRASRERSRLPGPREIAYLEANSQDPEVQAVIREAIRRGTVRVQPFPGDPDRVSIVSVRPGDKPGAGD